MLNTLLTVLSTSVIGGGCDTMEVVCALCQPGRLMRCRELCDEKDPFYKYDALLYELITQDHNGNRPLGPFVLSFSYHCTIIVPLYYSQTVQLIRYRPLQCDVIDGAISRGSTVSRDGDSVHSFHRSKPNMYI